jgi:hypothetical protein
LLYTVNDYSPQNIHMQTNNKLRHIGIAGISMAAIFLLSFIAEPGGDRIEIFLNDRLVVEQFVSQSSTAKSLALGQQNYGDRISVLYSHCGNVGKERKIVARDANNKFLKHWKFANASNGTKTMTWAAREILDLQSGSDRATIKLYYSSAELPEGRLVATVVRAKNYATQ